MTGKLKLMCVVAHPDDESLGMGGTLAKYASEGIETYLVTATRGERGRFGEGEVSPGLEVVGQMREAELLAAAQTLGIREVRFLGYIDGDLDQVDPTEAVAKIVAHLRRVKPEVVITFGPEGAYGHPDHIAISQLTTAAVVCAADSNDITQGARPTQAETHRVSKFYYLAWSKDKWAAYLAAFRDLKIRWMAQSAGPHLGQTGQLRRSLIRVPTGKRCGKPCPAIRLKWQYSVNWSICPLNTINLCGDLRSTIVPSAWSMEGEHARPICLRDCANHLNLRKGDGKLARC